MADKITVTLLNGFALATVIARKGQAAALTARAAELYAVELPTGARYVHGAQIGLIGMAPGAWMAVAQTADPEWAEALATNFKGLASVTDQSDAYVGVQISGPDAAKTLGLAIGIDLHPDMFTVGAAAVTTAAHLGLILGRIGPDTFHLMSFRSYANSFRHWLAHSGMALADG